MTLIMIRVHYNRTLIRNHKDKSYIMQHKQCIAIVVQAVNHAVWSTDLARYWLTLPLQSQFCLIIIRYSACNVIFFSFFYTDILVLHCTIKPINVNVFMQVVAIMKGQHKWPAQLHVTSSQLASYGSVWNFGCV